MVTTGQKSGSSEMVKQSSPVVMDQISRIKEQQRMIEDVSEGINHSVSNINGFKWRENEEEDAKDSLVREATVTNELGDIIQNNQRMLARLSGIAEHLTTMV